MHILEDIQKPVGMKFIKALRPDGRSIFFDYQWDLPQYVDGVWEPGSWHEVTGRISFAENGLHVTTNPFREVYRDYALFYVAEVGGPYESWGSDYAFQRVRLLYPWQPPSPILAAEERLLSFALPFGTEVTPHPEMRLRDERHIFDVIFKRCYEFRDRVVREYEFSSISDPKIVMPFYYSDIFLDDVYYSVIRQRVTADYIAWINVWSGKLDARVRKEPMLRKTREYLEKMNMIVAATCLYEKIGAGIHRDFLSLLRDMTDLYEHGYLPASVSSDLVTIDVVSWRCT
jgi:hypothetical protein